MASHYFPASYAQGRARFVELIAATAGTHEAHPHPLSGPAGEPLSLDVGIWGPDAAPSVLLVVAGTHGIEGFAGSGIMATLLTDGVAGQLGAHLKLIMVHALNPYGFAWERRVNEDNVDLNRNFVDHGAAYPSNPRYAELAGLVTPTVWTDSTAKAISNGLRAFDGRHPVPAAAVLSQGQYDHADGFFYGGNGPAWSNRLLTDIAARHLARARRVYHIDIHTGLGPFGEAEYIVEYPPESPQYQLCQSVWGNGLRSTKTGASRSADVSGSAMSGLAKFLGERVAGIGLEFGTVSMAQVIEALIADRWLHYHGDRGSDTGRAIRAKMRAAFYPDSEDWRAAITTTARLVVQQAIDHANMYANEHSGG